MAQVGSGNRTQVKASGQISSNGVSGGLSRGGHDERLSAARQRSQRAERQVVELMASIATIATMGDPPYPESVLAELRDAFDARERAKPRYLRVALERDDPEAP